MNALLEMGGASGGGSSLLNGLLAYYAFETLTADSSGNNQTLVNQGGVTQTAGIIGQAAQFSGSTFLNVADNAGLRPTAALTIAGWLWPGTAAANEPIMVKWTYSTDGGWSLDCGSDGLKLRFWAAATPNDGGSNFTGTGDILTNGVWQHVAVTYVAGAVSIYLNAVSQTNSGGGTIPSTLLTPAAALEVGHWQGLARFSSGKMDEMGLWNVALSQSQIASLYNSGAGRTYPFKGAA